jgi:hypothetical protein
MFEKLGDAETGDLGQILFVTKTVEPKDKRPYRKATVTAKYKKK